MELDRKNTLSLANNMPSGKFWRSKFVITKNIYKLLSALAKSFTDMDNRVLNLRNELFAKTANDLLPEHEKDYNLPNAIFTETSDVEIRKQQIALMQFANGLKTIEDFQNFLNNSGFDYVTVTRGDFDNRFPIRFPNKFGQEGGGFTVVLNAPVGTDITLLAEFVQTLVQATDKVEIKYN